MATEQNDQMAQLMKLLGGGGGMNPWVAGGMMALNTLIPLLSGPSAGEKRKRETFNMAKANLNANMLDPGSMIQDTYNMMRPEMNRRAGSVNKRLGLDAGVAQGELMNMFVEGAQNQMLGLKMKQAEMNMNNRNLMMQIMASLGS